MSYRTLLAYAAVLALAGPAAAAERYFVLVFGSESRPKVGWKTHSWITFLRVTDDGAGPATITAVDTVSWLPASLRIRPLAVRAEPGANLDLDATLAYVAADGERVAMWGPLEVIPLTYQRLMARKAELDAGRLRYKAFDPPWYPGSDSFANCFHVFTDLVPDYQGRGFDNAVYRNGFAGSQFLVHTLYTHGRVVGPENCHGGLLPALGLDRPDIERHAYQGHRFYLRGRD